MTKLDAIILGIVQGLTEFLPVSSSGHLHLFEYFLGLEQLDQYMLFDIACHLGTMLAIILMFYKPIKEVMTTDKSRLTLIIIATLPLFPLVALLQPIKEIYADPSFLGGFFLLTSAILFTGVYLGQEVSATVAPHSKRDAFFIGLWQALAILPGVSRSGSTISGARLLGWSPSDAMTFSFLLAIPTILGATLLEIINLIRHPNTVANVHSSHYMIGFFVSFGVGLCALKLLAYIISHNKMIYFAWYCLLLGLATTTYFLL